MLDRMKDLSVQTVLMWVGLFAVLLVASSVYLMVAWNLLLVRFGITGLDFGGGLGLAMFLALVVGLVLGLREE